MKITRKQIERDLTKAVARVDVRRRPPVRGYWGRSHHSKLEAGSVTMKERAVSWRRTLLEAMAKDGAQAVYRRKVRVDWSGESYVWQVYSTTPDGALIAAFDSAHESRLQLVRSHLDSGRGTFV